MQETERAMLSQAIPVCSWLGMSGQGHGGLLGRRQEEVGGWGSDRDEIEGLEGFKGRKELRRRWDEEWGRIGKEGNLWWLGSSKANWQAVMGTNKWTWFCMRFFLSSRRWILTLTFDSSTAWEHVPSWPLVSDQSTV